MSKFIRVGSFAQDFAAGPAIPDSDNAVNLTGKRHIMSYNDNCNPGCLIDFPKNIQYLL